MVAGPLEMSRDHVGRGGVAQLGERLNGIQEVRGSIPLASMAWLLDVGRLVA